MIAVGRRLHSEFPYIDAEVRYACREYAATAVDVIGRRLRLAFLNTQAAGEALPTIVNIMAEEYKWSEAEKKVRYISEHQVIDFMEVFKVIDKTDVVHYIIHNL